MTLTTTVGDDGVLHLDLPLGAAQAGCEVNVTVESVSKKSALSKEEWHELVRQTAGQWQGELN